MDDSAPGRTRSPGLLASLRRLGSTAVELLRTRFELIATEFEEERARVTRLVVFCAVAAFFLSLGVITLTLFVIVLAWDTHRVLATGILALVYLGLGTIAALKAR